MSENGLPKATMVNFIKDRISDKRKVSAEFTTLLLDLSKQFIDKISSHANEICEKEGKKTINNDHFFTALKEMGMGDIIKQLEKTDQILKKKQQKKNQQKARVQQNIQLTKKQSALEQEKNKEKLPILESNSKYKPIDLIDEEQNFVEILQQDLQEQDDEEGSEEGDEDAGRKMKSQK